MDADELRRRTKKAVSKWCDRPPESFFLVTPLNSLLTGQREALRQRNNQEFRGEHGFPISGEDWAETKLTTVGDVRDLNKKRLGS